MHPVLAAQAAAAAQALPREVHDYYAGGSGGEISVDEAERAWQRYRLRPRVLRDVADVDTSVELLGHRLLTPVLVAPTALHGLAHRDAEKATALGAADAGSLLVASTRTSLPLEQVPVGPWWFQVYVLRDRRVTRAMVEHAAAVGASALVVTGDTPRVAMKRRTGPPPRGTAALAALAQHRAAGREGDLVDHGDVEQDPSASLSVIGELAAASGLPVLVKGVLRGDDAVACLDAGAAGVVVSNHGGRQLDRAVPTARALPEVVDAVAGRAPVLVDGGLRSGADVLTALALGAAAVLVGRPVLWALAAAGADGVRDCLLALTADVEEAMALAGARTTAGVTRDLVVAAAD
ncbi:MAG TPA: alpha-hydroxy acid oxidase [Mycobacteriales bacterium]|nr:alpha-hydroxy acid oxidase [Mycobacteriales bacterium]